MRVFSYAFFQKKDKVYSYLKRNNTDAGRPFFDMVMFNECEYLNVDDEELWEKWETETSFFKQMDRKDFIFIVPLDTSLPIPKNESSSKTKWSKDDVNNFLNNIVGSSRILGDIDNIFSIEGIRYRIFYYTS